MDNDLTNAKHYRDQAKNLRALAAKDENTSKPEALLFVARTYDRRYTKCLGLAEPRKGSNRHCNNALGPESARLITV